VDIFGAFNPFFTVFSGWQCSVLYTQYALGEIQQLYRIEQMAEERKLSFKERAQLRTKLAEPIILSLEKWMEKTYSTVLPKSLMGQAIAYSYSIWPRMKHYLKEGRLNIDNNLAENAIRPIVNRNEQCNIFRNEECNVFGSNRATFSEAIVQRFRKQCYNVCKGNLFLIFSHF
jgi:hypothetical protein